MKKMAANIINHDEVTAELVLAADGTGVKDSASSIKNLTLSGVARTSQEVVLRAALPDGVFPGGQTVPVLRFLSEGKKPTAADGGCISVCIDTVGNVSSVVTLTMWGGLHFPEYIRGFTPDPQGVNISFTMPTSPIPQLTPITLSAFISGKFTAFVNDTSSV